MLLEDAHLQRKSRHTLLMGIARGAPVRGLGRQAGAGDRLGVSVEAQDAGRPGVKGAFRIEYAVARAGDSLGTSSTILRVPFLPIEEDDHVRRMGNRADPRPRG